jgi:hypothetical protein
MPGSVEVIVFRVKCMSCDNHTFGPVVIRCGRPVELRIKLRPCYHHQHVGKTTNFAQIGAHQSQIDDDVSFELLVVYWL